MQLWSLNIAQRYYNSDESVLTKEIPIEALVVALTSWSGQFGADEQFDVTC
jgi:hypothetical protein